MPRSLREAGEAIKGALRGGSLIVTKHAQDELADDGFDMNDLNYAIRLGRVVREDDAQDRYRMEGPLVDHELGKKVGIIFAAYNDDNRVLVITVFKVRGGRA